MEAQECGSAVTTANGQLVNDEGHVPQPHKEETSDTVPRPDGEDAMQELNADDPPDSDEEAPPKRRRLNPEQHFLTIRRRLFHDSPEPPTENIFYVEGERIDLTAVADRDNSVQRQLFGRIVKSLLYFSESRFSKGEMLDRDLEFEADLTKTRLKDLQRNNYREFHLHIPPAVFFVLRCLENNRNMNTDDAIFQLLPFTCRINSVKKRLRVNSVEVTEINGTETLDINLNEDVKFMYVGYFQRRTCTGKPDKCYVVPTSYMGNYLNVVVADLYNVIYNRVKEYIEWFIVNAPSVEVDVFEASQTKVPQQTSKFKPKVLKYLLDAVGQEVNLKKMDLDKNSVFALTSNVRVQPKYLRPTPNGTSLIEYSPPKTEAEAVFLSSYTRARIMKDGTLKLQVYSRTCMFTSECCDEFPPKVEQETST